MSLPRRSPLPLHRAPTPPGEMLLEEYLKPAGLTQTALAARLGAPARALRGEVVTASSLRPAVEDTLGHAVSASYLRDLLHRHDWRKLAPRPRHPEADVAVQEAYKKSSRAASRPRGNACDAQGA